jgi:hypothetical protein
MSLEQKRIKGIADIVQEIINLYLSGKDIDQQIICSKICSLWNIIFICFLGKYGISVPKFTDIILAIPEEYRC